jgi:hypothetical protein
MHNASPSCKKQAPAAGPLFKIVEAGNVSSDHTKAPVEVDPAKPRAAIIGVGPVGK